MSNDEFPMAYFITWTTYGTWLPGDERGWLKKGSAVIQAPDPALHSAAHFAMAEEPVILTQEQRALVDAVIVKHCEIRDWTLHTRNVRTNHIHVVVSAAATGEEVRAQLKAWCSRRLSELAGLSGKGRNGVCRWFTEKGDIRWIDGEEHLRNVVRYAKELQ